MTGLMKRMPQRLCACLLSLAALSACTPPPSDPTATDQWLNWGGNLRNTHHAENETAINVDNVHQLEVKWSYLTRGSVSAIPTVLDDAVYVVDWGPKLGGVLSNFTGSRIHAINRWNGDKIWSRRMSSLNASNVNNLSRTTPTIAGDKIIIGDLLNQAAFEAADTLEGLLRFNPFHFDEPTGAHVYALNRHTGELIWKQRLGEQPLDMITQSPTVYEDKVFIGVSSQESVFAKNPDSECCRFRGSFAALDVNTGDILWQHYMVPDNEGRLDQFSGGAVWGSSPAIDEKRRTVYIPTGNNYYVPQDYQDCVKDARDAYIGASENDLELALQSCAEKHDTEDNFFDAIVALDIDTGAVKWVTKAQYLADWASVHYYDAWTLACDISDFPFLSGTDDQCPTAEGPDADFGQAPMIYTAVVNGQPRELLGVGQKSGVFWALDPDSGQPVWATKVGPSSYLGGMEFGAATDGQRIYTQITNAEHQSFTLVAGARKGDTVNGGIWAALDAATGKVNWEVATLDPALPYTITGAPRVVKGKVLIGNGGAEFGVRGFLSAYDARDGSLAWRFYTVPGNPAEGFENDTMAMVAETWNGRWWELGGGGGTVWDSMAYDPELDLLYFGVGNGTPWNQELRSPGGGDNLFLSSIVAVRPDSGEYVWHYQTTPGESWDYTATQHIILADLDIEGEQRKVLMQAPKNGFFYVIDRATGELLSADNYINITWATHVDMETGRPVEVEGARYRDQPMLIYPSYLGGHNWHPMSFNPDTGLVYIPVLDIPATYGQPGEFRYNPGVANTGTDGVIAGLPDDQAERDAVGALVKGRLLAWNPRTQEEAWAVEYRGPWNGGTLSTAGNLVFQGTADGKFVAYRADNGEQLWSFAAQTGVVAPPITYEIEGEQYVSVNVGWGGAFALVFGEYVQAESLPNVGRILTFKLGADGKLPEIDWNPTVVFNPPPAQFDTATVELGHRIYQDVCMGCHGLNAVSGLLVPDLRGSAYLWDAEGWDRVVREGALKDRGMASFANNVSAAESQAIRAYAISQARRALRLTKAAAAP